GHKRAPELPILVAQAWPLSPWWALLALFRDLLRASSSFRITDLWNFIRWLAVVQQKSQHPSLSPSSVYEYDDLVGSSCRQKGRGMQVDFYGLAFETPQVTVHLWSPWRAAELEHRLFNAV